MISDFTLVSIFGIRLYNREIISNIWSHSSPCLVYGWLGLEIGEHDFSCMFKNGHILNDFLQRLQLIGADGSRLDSEVQIHFKGLVRLTCTVSDLLWAVFIWNALSSLLISRNKCIVPLRVHGRIRIVVNNFLSQNLMISWLWNVGGPMVRHNCHRISINTHASLVKKELLVYNQ